MQQVAFLRMRLLHNKCYCHEKVRVSFSHGCSVLELISTQPEELQTLRAVNETLQQKTHELTGQLKMVTEELNDAASVADVLRESLQQAQTSAG